MSRACALLRGTYQSESWTPIAGRSNRVLHDSRGLTQPHGLVGWLWGVWVVVGVGVGCPEFGVAWVPAGLWVGVGGAQVPAVVAGAPRVEGVHQVFVDEVVSSSVVGEVLRREGVGRPVVYVPVAGGGLGVRWEVALRRGREFGVPVLVAGGGLQADVWGSRVVAFAGGAQVVLPREHRAGGQGVWGVLRSAARASAVGGDGEPQAPPRVLADAVRGFPAWDGQGDCVVRADRLLTAWGVGRSDARDDGWSGSGSGAAVTVASLAARLGGVFTPATAGM